MTNRNGHITLKIINRLIRIICYNISFLYYRQLRAACHYCLKQEHKHYSTNEPANQDKKATKAITRVVGLIRKPAIVVTVIAGFVRRVGGFDRKPAIRQLLNAGLSSRNAGLLSRIAGFLTIAALRLTKPAAFLKQPSETMIQPVPS
jgi:hypothetical protein